MNTPKVGRETEFRGCAGGVCLTGGWAGVLDWRSGLEAKECW